MGNGFNGMHVLIVTCSDGYPQSYQYHNYSGSPEEGVRDMLRAGLDVDCAFGSGIALDAQTLSSALRMVRHCSLITRVLRVRQALHYMLLPSDCNLSRIFACACVVGAGRHYGGRCRDST